MSQCRAEIWKDNTPSHRCTRQASHVIVTNYNDEQIEVCWQHARSCRPYGQWVVERDSWGWVDVSSILRTEPIATEGEE